MASLVRVPQGFPLHSGRRGYYFSCYEARQDLASTCLANLLSSLLCPPTPRFWTSNSALSFNYLSLFLEFLELPKPFPASRFLYLPVSWLGLFFPWFPFVFPHQSSGFRLNCHFLRGEVTVPSLWPCPTTPIHLQVSQSSCSFFIALTTICDSGPCLFCFPCLQNLAKN